MAKIRWKLIGVLVILATFLTAGSYVLMLKLHHDRESVRNYREKSAQKRPDFQQLPQGRTENPIPTGQRPLPPIPQPPAVPNTAQQDSVQRTLRTVEEINRINQMNQRLMEQQRTLGQ